VDANRASHVVSQWWMQSNEIIQQAVKVRYTNYRDETALRIIVPQRIFWGSNEYHQDEQWLLEVLDVEKNAPRVYALKDISEWSSADGE